MKVADLSGAELDYWVAKALAPSGDEVLPGLRYGPAIVHGECRTHPESPYSVFSPSRSWAHGGPIIERELNAVERFRGDDMAWIASYGDPECPRSETGPTPLIAAMRAFVAHKFGDEVPEEK
ncbi:DUF2591 domain-containing protein [Schlegelella sp. S2-27]|uniref:DUF2591 domain-containing protein n=1 Tax=Caldimonas mangrovi TaxID=2944811 RepID=A0ABT0YUV7_9BURK|nr:phage protein NinX family protein [Caldimonas mangrovi]MCM5682530.1 DUF2591 domain-containing protein [Caldimonas mangrovi]